MTPALYADCARAAYVIRPDGTRHRGARAALHVLRGLGWRLVPALFWYPPMKWAADLGYWLFARNRSFFAPLVRRLLD